METKQQKIIDQKIKKWWTKQKLIQEGLARKADISYITFLKIEKIVVKNTFAMTVNKIAQALSIFIDE